RGRAPARHRAPPALHEDGGPRPRRREAQAHRRRGARRERGARRRRRGCRRRGPRRGRGLTDGSTRVGGGGVGARDRDERAQGGRGGGGGPGAGRGRGASAVAARAAPPFPGGLRVGELPGEPSAPSGAVVADAEAIYACVDGEIVKLAKAGGAPRTLAIAAPRI